MRSDRTDLMAGMDSDFDEFSGASSGFEARIAATPYASSADAMAGCRARYDTIKKFQAVVIDIFRASLARELDPRIADGVLGDVPSSFGHAYHRELPDGVWTTPVYFRTDEAKPGQLTEIQCSGSGWGLAQAIYACYQRHSEQFGRPEHFSRSLASCYARDLEQHLGAQPIVHHLVDSASRPHGGRYFIQKARQEGVRYFSYDGEVRAQDCNFVRSHDFFSLLHHNFFKDRVNRCDEVVFDLPPIAAFDTKFILAWPFWSLTRSHFSDEVRALFPYTAVIERDGIEWEDGGRLSAEEFAAIPNRKRNYFFKYAGTDVAINWGSKAVFSTGSLTRGKCAERLESIMGDIERGRPWIVQKAVLTKESIESLCPATGAVESFTGNGKWSNFYGSTGHLAQLVMHRNAHKVHGSGETVMSLVY